MSIVITLNSFSLYQPAYQPSSFAVALADIIIVITDVVHEKKDLINYAFCIVEWMRENNWIESCPWIERDIRRRKTSFLCLRQCIFYTLCIRIYAMYFTKIAFRELLLFCLFFCAFHLNSWWTYTRKIYVCTNIKWYMI